MYRETNIFPIFVRQPLEYLTKKENKLDYRITIDLKDPRWIDKNEKNTRDTYIFRIPNLSLVLHSKLQLVCFDNHTNSLKHECVNIQDDKASNFQ